MKIKQEKIEIGDIVETPEGRGKIREDTVFGQFCILIEGIGRRWYFPEDIKVIERPKNENHKTN